MQDIENRSFEATKYEYDRKVDGAIARVIEDVCIRKN
jgi:hypothetical protein